MSTVTLERPAAVAGPRTGRRPLGAVAAAAVLALAAATVASLLAGPQRVTPTFPGTSDVMESEWGSVEEFGVPGSRILGYRHDTTVEMRLPWSGGPVVAARLGTDPVHLLTVTDVARDGDELVLGVARDNCAWFHERAVDMFRGVTVVGADGGTTEVLFDRPLFVKSPMLASCPDRTLDRQDDVRAGYDRYDR